MKSNAETNEVKTEPVELELATDPIPELVAEIAAGRMVVVMDDKGRENEGDLVMAAATATSEQVAFFVRQTSGIICLPTSREHLERLHLPQMVPDNTEMHQTAFTVSVDYRHGTTTGISAHDRARTIRALADPAVKPGDFSRPGHIFPLRYAEGGVLCRAGHTEASVDLARLAGLGPTAVISEIVNEDGSMKRGSELIRFAREHGLKVGTIADLIRYRLRTEKSVERLIERTVPTPYGEFRLVAYEDHVHAAVHLALIRGEIDPEKETRVRVQLQSTLGDVLGIQWPALGWPLAAGMERIGREGGVLILLRQPEDPAALIGQIEQAGVGSASRAAVGEEEADALRTYGIGAQILTDLGVHRMQVYSAPRRMQAISGFGLEIIGYIEE